ncbi:lytic transglycosylase domain-containing protein [Demequina sp.]|uniref:lytic transglycosylase domain-containing protein n=1 Tax=Demequina sp. TaxID=2050685 RepID=UPI0025B84ED1|nr:lytic transglycosylase domain-containing protein [Demequina sp.]
MDTRTATRRAIATSLTAAALAMVSLPAQAHTDHVVAPGDTVSGLAATYGVPAVSIMEANDLNASATIYIGERLTIPTSSPAHAPVTHVVVRGDTVWDIAAAYGVTVAHIRQANALNAAATIRIGQTLAIPGATTSPSTPELTATAPSLTYVVRSGDTVWSIATRHGTTVAAIADANALKDPGVIRVGQALTVPGGAPTGLVPDTFLGRTYPADVVAAANVNKATLNAMDVPSRTQMQHLVIDTANSMGVDPALAQAIAYQESGFNQRAVSPANAIGCMQVIPTSGEWASDLVGRELDLLVPEDNVTAGVAILRRLQRDGTDLDTAIAGYYQGERSVRTRGMNSDTVRYVASVKALMSRFD